MKKLLIVVALMVSIGLVGGLTAQPASAFFGGLGNGFGSGFGFFGAGNCGPAVCAPVYCAPVYCAPVCAPYYYAPCGKVKKAAKAKKMKKK